MNLIAATRAEGGLVFIRTSKIQVRLPMFLGFWNFSIFSVLNRGQTEPDYPAEYGFIRKRIIPLGFKRIAFQNIRFRLLHKRIG